MHALQVCLQHCKYLNQDELVLKVKNVPKSQTIIRLLGEF
jgi:hypothetical protein